MDPESQDHTELQSNNSGGSGIENILTAVIQKGMSLMQAIGFPKEQLEFIYEYGIGLFKSKNYNEASNIFLFLCQINGKDPRFPFAYASCQYKMTNLEGAIQFYSLSALLDNENPSVWYNLGDCYMQLQAYDLALTTLNRCIDAADVQPEYSTIKQEAVNMRNVILHQTQGLEVSAS